VRIHLDHLNGAPLLPEAAAAISQALGKLANPSAPYAEGREAARLRDRARGQVAALLGARPDEILFTSSGTESNLWALSGLARSVLRQAQGERRNHIVLSAVEHLSLLQGARQMEKEGWEITVVPVDHAGRVDSGRVEQALTPRTALVSVQWANAEVGALQPVAELARRVKQRGVLFHSDAVAAAGRVPVDVREMPADALSLAANIWGGPPGVGALYLRKGVRILPLMVGGTQEEGRRAGTENLAGIIGMGAAAAAVAERLGSFAAGANPLREKLVRGILELSVGAALNGPSHPTERLPGHASVSFPGVDAEGVVLSLDMEGICASSGSACSSGSLTPSHVLSALGLPDTLCNSLIRLSLGRETSDADIQYLLSKISSMLCHFLYQNLIQIVVTF